MKKVYWYCFPFLSEYPANRDSHDETYFFQNEFLGAESIQFVVRKKKLMRPYVAMNEYSIEIVYAGIIKYKFSIIEPKKISSKPQSDDEELILSEYGERNFKGYIRISIIKCASTDI